MKSVKITVYSLLMNHVQRARTAFCLLGLIVGLGFAPIRVSAVESQITLQQIAVSGMGWSTNRTLHKQLSLVMSEESGSAPLGIPLLEDAAWILDDAVRREGYLKPSFSIRLRLSETEDVTLSWSKSEGLSAAPPPIAKEIEFNIDPGVLYHYASLHIEGLEVLPDFQVTPFFYRTDQWLKNRKSRLFTPARFDKSLKQLMVALREKGYREVSVSKKDSTLDDATGAVDARVAIELGPPHYVREVILKIDSENTDPVPSVLLKKEHAYSEPLWKPFAPSWLSNEMLGIRRTLRSGGYVDAKTKAHFKAIQMVDGRGLLDLEIVVAPGQRKQIGAVEVVGQESISSRIIERSVLIRSGEVLDPEQINETEKRLSRLDIFKKVSTEYSDRNDTTRDVVFQLEPLPRDTIRLNAGVGSYDVIRGGVVWQRNNLWKRAHRSEFSILQSLRMTHVEYDYHIPRILNRNIHFFAQAEYLQREEISFDQEEWGISAGVTYPWERFGATLTAQYNFQTLSSSNEFFEDSDTLEDARVGSLEFKFRKIHLDNPVYPSNGSQLFANLEVALPELGGQVNYSRLTFGGAYYHEFAAGLIGRVGLQQGVIWSGEGGGEKIPLNRRFFLGGENTVRGYRQGQASPVDVNGEEIGAEVYTLFQIEVEQRLNQLLGLVVFSDSVAVGEDGRTYSYDEWLHSVGVGIRIKTLLGPLRLEYGHNLNPRSFDPRGTIQVGLGLPF